MNQHSELYEAFNAIFKISLERNIMRVLRAQLPTWIVRFIVRIIV